MVTFPHCKINIGLHVHRKRGDGYHDLETAFYPLPLKDVLEIIPSDKFRFTTLGQPIPGDPQTNLCVKAYDLLKKDFPGLPPVDAYLYKDIPLGAGLGGGSADGALMLKTLNTIFRLHLTDNQLATYALLVGSDCPFFLHGQPCLATGRGERLEPLALDLSAWSIVLVYPGIHIDTTWAFSALNPQIPQTPLKTILAQPVETWRSELVNDFEAPVCKNYPVLQQIKDKLYQAGAVYASMTGSGSAFYGLFPKGPRQPRESHEPQVHIAPRHQPHPDPGGFPGYFFRIL